MGKKAVRVTGALWQQICTVGWRMGGLSRHGLECTEGLPEGATFCAASYEAIQYEEASPCLVLILTFEHPDWPEVEPGQDLPTIGVVWEETYDDRGL